MNDEELKIGDIMQPMMAVIMLVIISQIIQILPQPKGELAVTSLELS
jgi:hypothetical protein